MSGIGPASPSLGIACDHRFVMLLPQSSFLTRCIQEGPAWGRLTDTFSLLHEIEERVDSIPELTCQSLALRAHLIHQNLVFFRIP
jgi:hypothetical protein